ncbi:MAG: penicillin acylase family protein [Pyrinomonadaceae bacterium]
MLTRQVISTATARRLVALITAIGAVIAFQSTIRAQSAAGTKKAGDRELWRRVEIIRTSYGVPHIRAEDLRAAGYALAWLQCEDYGDATPMRLLEASGRRASVEGADFAESDLVTLFQRSRSLKNYRLLSQQARDVYEGFAAGVNRYVELNRDKFPKFMPADFTGEDVAATEIVPFPARKARLFVERLTGGRTNDRDAGQQTGPNDEGEPPPDDGSNAWAFAPSRTRSGRAILLRNPHLSWTAGYYEAHLTVPGVVDFYGDFRIGGAFAVVGGFNRYLGFSTTNNSPDLDEFYELDADPANADHYLFDGRSVAMTKVPISVAVRKDGSLTTVTREFWTTDLGPVVHRTRDKIYIVKFAGDGDVRAGEQFLRMMRARTLGEWKSAMRMRSRVTSNFTYADRDGNIFYIWNASLPLLPHPPSKNDLDAVPAKGARDVWTRYVPFDSLPQLLNPKGGYLHNENNSPHFTNVERGVSLKNAYPNFEAPELSLRAQLGLRLARGSAAPSSLPRLSLEDVVRLKHDYRALLADRVKPDLIAAVRAAGAEGELADAIRLLDSWDNTTAPESRGSTLFEEWWATYSGLRRTDVPAQQRRAYPDERRFAKVWDENDPFATPRGLADPARAVESLRQAVDEVKRRYGSIDVTWGEVHRVRRGKVDAPVGGCGNDLGCFRILGFTRDAKDGRLVANSGDAWVLAVEFGRSGPRAYSVLAYGQSRLPASPHFDDQAEMFARGEMKKVAFTPQDIARQTIRRYRPGK